MLNMLHFVEVVVELVVLIVGVLILVYGIGSLFNVDE